MVRDGAGQPQSVLVRGEVPVVDGPAQKQVPHAAAHGPDPNAPLTRDPADDVPGP